MVTVVSEEAPLRSVTRTTTVVVPIFPADGVPVRVPFALTVIHAGPETLVKVNVSPTSSSEAWPAIEAE